MVIKQIYNDNESRSWGGVLAYCLWLDLDTSTETRVHYLHMSQVSKFLPFGFFTTRMTDKKRNHVFYTDQAYLGENVPYAILAKVEHGIPVSKMIILLSNCIPPLPFYRTSYF